MLAPRHKNSARAVTRSLLGVALVAILVLPSAGGAWREAGTVGELPIPEQNDGIGVVLALQGNRLVAGIPGDPSSQDDAGSVLVYDVSDPDAPALVQEIGLAASDWSSFATPGYNIHPSPGFGKSVAMDGDLLVVGAQGRVIHGTGWVFVYTWNATFGKYIEASRFTAADVNHRMGAFGDVVAIDGNRIAVAAPWSATLHIFESTTGPDSWKEVAVLDLSYGAAAASDATGDWIADIDIEGDRVVAGVPFPNPETSAMVIERQNGGTWDVVANLVRQTGWGGGSGVSVALEGNRIAVGVRDGNETSNGRGAVHILRLAEGVWSEEHVIPAQTGGEGQFGISLDLDGRRLAIGDPQMDSWFDSTGQWGGAAYVAALDNASQAWGIDAAFDDPVEVEWRSFGGSVALDGQLLAVGTSQQGLPDDGSPAFHLYVTDEVPDPAFGDGGTTSGHGNDTHDSHRREPAAISGEPAPIAHANTTGARLVVVGDAGTRVDLQPTSAAEPSGLPEPVPPVEGGLRYLQVESNGTDWSQVESVNLTLTYNSAVLDGTDPDDLAIHYWDGTGWVDLTQALDDGGHVEGRGEPDLEVLDGGHDRSRRVVWVLVNHTSTYALAPQQGTPDSQEGASWQPIFVLAGILVVAAIVVWVANGVLLAKRRR